MPSPLPPGDPAPPDGTLPVSAVDTVSDTPFSIYVHVPYCLRRCGYCDFNTYTLAEAAEAGPTAYLDAAHRELDLAARVLGAHRPPVETVFFGGGTPTLLSTPDLGDLLRGIAGEFGIAPGAEITVEANPDTIDEAVLERLADAGFTRVSVGMQSAVPHVLATLDRTHTTANVARAINAARRVGLQSSVDLIYGTPGESFDDWRRSLAAAIELEPGHISAYALVVEPGTPLAAHVAAGRVPAPSDDDEADKYDIADELLAAAGYTWYEVSNWARSDAQASRHNLAYWRGANWWGIGPGAHSHIGGVRWWNVKHPRTYAGRLAVGESPAAAREILTAEQQYAELVLLRSRLATGFPVDLLAPQGRSVVPGLIAEGLIEGSTAVSHRLIRLTRCGRLLADTVVRRLLG